MIENDRVCEHVLWEMRIRGRGHECIALRLVTKAMPLVVAEDNCTHTHDTPVHAKTRRTHAETDTAHTRSPAHAPRM